MKYLSVRHRNKNYLIKLNEVSSIEAVTLNLFNEICNQGLPEYVSIQGHIYRLHELVRHNHIDTFRLYYGSRIILSTEFKNIAYLTQLVIGIEDVQNVYDAKLPLSIDGKIFHLLSLGSEESSTLYSWR